MLTGGALMGISQNPLKTGINSLNRKNDGNALLAWGTGTSCQGGPHNNILTYSKEAGMEDDSVAIGKSYAGGKIFWLDITGKHGLIAAVADQSAKGIAWNPGKAVATGATADAVYAGRANTERILSVLGQGVKSAAKLCSEYTTAVNGVEYRDWYLPSRSELVLLFKQHAMIGGFNTSSGIYWSSTEAKARADTMAWEQEFKYGNQYEDEKDNEDMVRCIRKF